MGYLNLRPEQTNIFFKLMEERYRQRATIITTNLDYAAWATFLGNKALVDALLSRLRHQCHTVVIDGLRCATPPADPPQRIDLDRPRAAASRAVSLSAIPSLTPPHFRNRLRDPDFMDGSVLTSQAGSVLASVAARGRQGRAHPPCPAPGRCAPGPCRFTAARPGHDGIIRRALHASAPTRQRFGARR
jgi:IstB-like ATP binding protein